MKKRILVGIMVMLCFCAVGCGNKQAKYDQAMEEYARDYYERKKEHLMEIDVPEITLALLKNDNAYGDGKYDLKKLEKCSDKSTAKIIFKENTREIDHVELKMNCKK